MYHFLLLQKAHLLISPTSSLPVIIVLVGLVLKGINHHSKDEVSVDESLSLVVVV
jgi:hypothetical protein